MNEIWWLRAVGLPSGLTSYYALLIRRALRSIRRSSRPVSLTDNARLSWHGSGRAGGLGGEERSSQTGPDSIRMPGTIPDGVRSRRLQCSSQGGSGIGAKIQTWLGGALIT